MDGEVLEDRQSAVFLDLFFHCSAATLPQLFSEGHFWSAIVHRGSASILITILP